MNPMFDWIKGVFDSVATWTKEQWSRVLVAALIIFAIWRMITVEVKNTELTVENRNLDAQCNIIINNIKDSMSRENDSLRVEIYVQKLGRVEDKTEVLQNTVDELKKLKENVNRVKRNNDRIIKAKN